MTTFPNSLTLEGFKEFAGISSTQHDSTLTTILAGVEQYFYGYTNIQPPGTEVKYYDKQQDLFLEGILSEEDPTITAVGSTSTEREYTLALEKDVDYLYTPSSGYIYVFSSSYENISTLDRSIRIELTIPDANPLPEAVVHACYELAKLWQNNKFVQSKTQRGQSVANFNTGTEIPPQIKAVFDKYRIA